LRRHTKTGHGRPKTADLSRRSPLQKRAQATPDTILEAAAQILEEEGPDALTTAYLSDRSGYAIGTVYQYLPTKEAIFHAIRERGAERIGELVEAALARRDTLSAEEIAGIIVDAVLDGFSARPQMRRTSSRRPSATRAWHNCSSRWRR
jgi:AcrR family transcriptional regulator